MYTYYGVEHRKYNIVFPLVDENERIIGKLYGKEKLSREEMYELNQRFEENDIEIEKNLKEIPLSVEFSENESDDINNLIRENTPLRLAFSHNYIMNSDLGALIQIIREIKNKPQKLIEALEKINDQRLNLIVR